MKLIWHGYLVSNLDIYAHETPTETGLSLQPTLTQEPIKFMRQTNEPNINGGELNHYISGLKNDLQKVLQSAMC